MFYYVENKKLFLKIKQTRKKISHSSMACKEPYLLLLKLKKNNKLNNSVCNKVYDMYV